MTTSSRNEEFQATTGATSLTFKKKKLSIWFWQKESMQFKTSHPVICTLTPRWTLAPAGESAAPEPSDPEERGDILLSDENGGHLTGQPTLESALYVFPTQMHDGGRPLWCAALTSNQPVVHSRHSFHFTFNFNFSMLIRENPINPVILGSLKGAICIFGEDIFIYLSLKQYNK